MSNPKGNSQITKYSGFQRLDARRERFVHEYLKSGNGTAAAKLAGFPPKGAAQTAWKLLRRDKAVIAEISRARGEMQERTMVTVETMIAQFDADREFAVETKNATAAVRASELKAKLCGLLVDRIDQRTAGALHIEIVKFSTDGTGEQT